MGHTCRVFVHSGDHTVKVVDCASGETMAVLDGHLRTPWVVSCKLAYFGPYALTACISHAVMMFSEVVANGGVVPVRGTMRPQVLASGSLDHVVMVWETQTGQRLTSHNFGAFGAVLAALDITCTSQCHMNVCRGCLFDLVCLCACAWMHTGKPIASVAFHSEGDIMVVASGHKVSVLICAHAANVPALSCKQLAHCVRCTCGCRRYLVMQ